MFKSQNILMGSSWKWTIGNPDYMVGRVGAIINEKKKGGGGDEGRGVLSFNFTQIF